MNQVVLWAKPFFFVIAFAVATAFITSDARSMLIEGPPTYCTTYYPGDPYCHDDLDRTENPKEGHCLHQGCHSKKFICCLPEGD